jgi:hypothetical protein
MTEKEKKEEFYKQLSEKWRYPTLTQRTDANWSHELFITDSHS